MVRLGWLHMSGLKQLAGHLTEENHEAILLRAKHWSRRAAPAHALSFASCLRLRIKSQDCFVSGLLASSRPASTPRRFHVRSP